MPLAPEWQHPFVNVFKICDVDTLKEFETKGDVTEHMDKIIGKKVFKVRGVIPAGNYLRVPRSKLQSLGLTGRILYIQLKVTPVKVFVVHIEAVTSDGNVHRVSISNMYNADALKRKSNGVQLAFPQASHRWCILAVDMRTALRGFTSSPYASIKAVQMCSWLTVRTMFTSDYKFNLVNLPSDMALSHALDSGVFEMVWLPQEPVDAPTMDFMPPPKRITGTRRTIESTSAVGGGDATPFASARKASDPTPPKTTPRPSSTGGGGTKSGGAARRGRVSRGSMGSRRSGGDAVQHSSGDDADADGDDQLTGDVSSVDEQGKPPPPSPVRLSLSPVTAAAVTSRATTANIAAGTAAAAVVGAAAVPKRPGDVATASFPQRNPALNVPAQGQGQSASRTASGAAAAAPASRRPPVAAATLGAEAVVQGPPLQPDPALTLERMNAYSGEFVRCLVWIPGGDDVAFAAASVVVIMNFADVPSAGTAPGGTVAVPGRQRHCLGHTAFVCALASASNGELLVSAQEGKDAVVRLWDVASCACLAILNAHASGLSCVDISPDVRAVAAVGLDAHGRQTIALWNISEMRNPHRKIQLVTRHATEFNIKVLRFSVYQEDHLLTAGRDSIRIYRLKGGQLRGTSVRLVPQDKRVTSHIGGVSAAMGPNIFTDVAFEAGVGLYGVDAFKVYVSSASGAVFQVDYTTRQLDAVFQLHSAPINCLLVADGLAITGSDDRLLRAWPLDFKDYLLEAEHEGSVTGLALSPDALRVAIGTENGALGCLHIPNHSYTTLLRSHSAPVNAVAVDPNRDQYCTASSDGTVRIWHLLTHQQLYEFDAPGEAVTCIAYHPLPTHHELAAGFANGRVRVFDVASTTVVQEQHQHRAAVAELAFTPSGERLFSGGADGALVMYDVPRLYAPTQYLSAGVRDIKVCVAVSPDGAYFASLIRDPYRGVTSLLLFHGKSMDPFMRIETDAPAYVKLAFSPDSKELWALSSNRRLDRYELTEGYLVQQIFDVCPLDVSTLAMDPIGRYVLTAGNDGLLRLWARLPQAALAPRALPPHQAFLGHPNTVLGAAFHRGHLITVGEADCICVWRVVADTTPQAQELQAARAAAALRLAELPPALRPAPDATATTVADGLGVYASPPRAQPDVSGLLDPHNPLSRASPKTALGSVATVADHKLTTRAAALGIPLPPGTLLVPAPAVPIMLPGVGSTTAGGAAAAVLVVPNGGTAPGPTSPSAALAFNSAANAFSSLRLSNQAPLAAAASPTTSNSPSFAPKPVPQPSIAPTPTLPTAAAAAGGATQTSTLAQWAAAGAAASAGPPPPSPGALQLGLELHPPVQPHYLTSPQRQASLPHSQSHSPAPPQPLVPPVPQPPQPPPRCDWLLGYTPTGCNNVAWRSETGLFAYTVEDMVVLEHLGTRHQRYLRGHNRPLACLAASADGTRVAAAPSVPEPYNVEPSTEAAALTVPCSTAPFADVVVWEVASGEERWRLRYHTKGVQALSFSPDGRWLLSLGRSPERSVVLWDVTVGQLVAVGRTEQVPLAVDWLWGGDHPAFASVGAEGLLLWTLQDSFLEQRNVPLNDQNLPVPCTAVAVDPAGAVLVAQAPTTGGDGGGGGGGRAPGRVAIWHVEAAPAIAGGSATLAQVASLPGDSAVTGLVAGHDYALVATSRGHVVRFRRSTLSGTWAEDSSVRLDGAVLSLNAEPGMGDVVAATATSTIWFVGMQDGSAVPIVCGQPAPIQTLVPAPHDPRVMASTSTDGLLRVWRLGPEDAEPIIELHSSAACTAAAFVLRAPRSLPPAASDTASESAASDSRGTPPQPVLLGGYSDGSLRLFALGPGVELQWALARHPAPVVGVVPHPLRGLVLSASSDGSLAITDLGSTRLVSYITTFTALGPASPSAAPPPHRSPRSSPPPPAPPAPARPGTGSMQAFAVSAGVGASVAAVAWRDRFVVFATPWDDPACAPIATYDCQPANVQHSGEHSFYGPQDVPALLAFVGSATKLLTYSSPLMLGVVLVYDYRLAAVVRRVTIPQMIRSLALSPDGCALVLGSTQRTVFLVHLATGSYEALEGQTGPVVAVAFSADGSRAVTAAGSVLMVWNAEEALRKLEPPPPLPPRRTLFQV